MRWGVPVFEWTFCSDSRVSLETGGGVRLGSPFLGTGAFRRISFRSSGRKHWISNLELDDEWGGDQAWLPNLSGEGLVLAGRLGAPAVADLFRTHPGFTIDSYTNFELNLLAWDSWSLVILDIP